MTKAVLQRIVSASFLFLASTASAVYAQSVSVPFPEGFIGTVGSSRNFATDIHTFTSLEIDRAQFIQPSTTGLFTIQGNDINGTLRLVFDDGTVIDVPGAINWRDAQGGTLDAFGFIPDPLNPPRTISYGSSNQFTMTLNEHSNYGLRVIGSSQNYATVTNVTGNAATNGLLEALNDYLGTLSAPVLTGPSGGPGAAASAKTVNEGTTAVATLAADEAVTWALAGGADAALFALDPATGALTFQAAPDYEGPADSDIDNVYEVVVEATDAHGNTAQQTVTVTVADLDDSAPVLTGPSGSEEQQVKTVSEGETLVATFTANEDVTWSLDGGTDRAAFTLDPVTGVLRFATPPDFGAPTDSDRDNVYIVSVVAVDAAGNRTEITIAVMVADTDAPAITGPSGGAGSTSSATSVDEGVTAVATMGADEAVTWAISGGPDSGRFAIDPVTGALRFVAPPDFEAPNDHDGNNSYVVTVTATDAQGNTSQQTVTVQVRDLTDTPTELFEERQDEVVAIIEDVEENHLRAAVSAHQDMLRGARDRFIEGQRQQALCHDLDDPNRPVTSAPREGEECSPLATRNDVPFDIDGQLEAGSDGIFGAGTFFGQTGSFDGTNRRIVEGEFQLLDDGEGIETFDITGRVAWEKLVAGDLLLGAYLGGSAARSDVDRTLDGTVDKASLSFGTYVVAEPVDNLYLDGFLSLGAGRNDLALADDRLALDGEYTTRSLLVGGAVSGAIEREGFEIRPELSAAYGITSFGDLHLDATAFGMTEEVTAMIDGVDYATVRLTPEILVPLQGLSDDATLVVAPSLACEWTDGDRACGGGVRVGLRGTSPDGMTGWTISAAADRIGDTARTGVEASVEHKF